MIDASMVQEDCAEVRSVPLTDVSVSDDGLRFSGYAAVFDAVADLGDFTEEIRRGAFRKALAQGDNIPLTWDHDDRMPPLATTRGGTLRLTEDTRGLRVEADLDADHYMTPTLRSMIRRGDVSGMSFGFVAGRGNSLIEERNGRPHRALTNFKKILDVCTTWRPAYDGTSAEIRSALAEIQKARFASDQQQTAIGEYRQDGDGASDDGTETSTQDTATAVEEQPSGVTNANEAEAAARRRRLQMMGLSLPTDDMTWLADGQPAEKRAVVRELDDLLTYPPETWSVEERSRVTERRRQVHKAIVELVDGAERVGRNLTDEEAQQFDSLQSEFRRLSR